MVLIATRRTPPLRCSYCHEAVAKPLVCQLCGTAVHTECRSELRRCPALGCRGVLPEAPLPSFFENLKAFAEFLMSVTLLGIMAGAALVFFLGTGVLLLFLYATLV